MHISEKRRFCNVDFGERLARLRTCLKFSQETLAEAVGVTARSISRWECNKSIPQQYYLERLLEVLQVSPEELFGERKEKLQPKEQLSLFWHVPYARNSCFSGRQEILYQLHQKLHTQEQISWIRPHFLCGLGGIGKTQIALEYAYCFRDDYQAVLWVRAETSETLLADYTALAKLFQVSQKDCSDYSVNKHNVNCWLQSHFDWLLIIDGLEDPILLDTVLPKSNQGHILITTRSPFTNSLGFSILVQKMTLAESSTFLLRRIGFLAPDMPLEKVPASLRAQAETLSTYFDGLPLALDQAGAYIEESACGLSDYLDHYSINGRALLNNRGITSSNHPESVRETISVCFYKIKCTSPLAADLLCLCAFLSTDTISEELLTRIGKHLGSSLYVLSADPFLLDELVRELRRFSLLHRETTTRTLHIHRLVQLIIQNEMDENERKHWMKLAEQII